MLVSRRSCTDARNNRLRFTVIFFHSSVLFCSFLITCADLLYLHKYTPASTLLSATNFQNTNYIYQQINNQEGCQVSYGNGFCDVCFSSLLGRSLQ
jgi:hypothetical protein